MSDDALLALSDALVVRALERAAGRMGRSGRSGGTPRHQVYRVAPPGRDTDQLLQGAWDLCGEYAYRHRLPFDSNAWARALQGYTAALLATRNEHTLDDLARALYPLRLHHAC